MNNWNGPRKSHKLGCGWHPHQTPPFHWRSLRRSHGGHAEPEFLQKRFHKIFHENIDADIPMDRTFWKKIVYKTYGETCPESNFEACFNDLWGTFAKGHRWALIDGVENTLHQLKRQGFQLVILSNNDSRLRSVLEDKGMAPLFDELFISEEIGCRKPSIEVFRHVEKTLGLKPIELLHVGDSPREDYHGARNAGWNAVLVARKCPPGVQESDWVTNLNLVPTIGRQKQIEGDQGL